MPWAVVGAVAAAGISAAVSSDSSRKAAHAQQDAANQANATGNAQFDATREDQRPYREAGYGALSKLNDLLGLSDNKSVDGYGSLAKPFTGADLTKDPGYQFGLSQGQHAIDSSAAARGGLYSGATLKALDRYGNDYGSTKFNDAFNRNQTENNALANKLQSVAGIGQTATNQVGMLGAQNAALAGQNLIGASNATAANSLAQGNALGGAANQIGSYAKTQWGGTSTPIYGTNQVNPSGGNWNSGTYDGGQDGTAALGW